MKIASPGSVKKSDRTAGSPEPGEPVFLAVGRLKRAHGLQGEIVMEILTDFPERLIKGKTVYCGNEHAAQVIRSLRAHNEGALVGFAGLDTPEAVGSLTNQTVFVRSDELPALPEGEYYHHQLLGLAVIDQDGESLGVLVEILQTGANDVYVVKQADASELLLPAIDEVILFIDLSKKVIQVKPPEWL